MNRRSGATLFTSLLKSSFNRDTRPGTASLLRLTQCAEGSWSDKFAMTPYPRNCSLAGSERIVGHTPRGRASYDAGPGAQIVRRAHYERTAANGPYRPINGLP